MPQPYSIDYVARTSDEAAVRAAFDARTLTWLRVLAVIAVIAAFPHMIGGIATNPWRATLGALSFVIAIITLIAVRKSAKSRLAALVKARVRPVAISFALAQTALLVWYHAPNDDVVPISIVLAGAMVAFRLLPTEHILLHLGLVAVSIAPVLVMPPQRHIVAFIVPSVVMNALILTVALFFSRRARKQIVAEWSERRVSALEQIRMRDELAYARELQLSMLPECAPRLDWADICSISVPATEVGGDYYDYFVDEDRVVLVCGDVAGHGMASGLVLSALRTGFMLLRESLARPSAVLQRLHEVIGETTRRRMLVTVAVVLLEQRTRRAVVASAGHPPVIVRHADGSISTMNLFAPPLGVRLPVTIPQRELRFAAGDTFVLHSDGIYETRNAAGEVYGLDRLESVISHYGGGTAEELRDMILRDVAAFRGTVEQDDDVTIVACRML